MSACLQCSDGFGPQVLPAVQGWATGFACGAGVGHKPALDLSFLKHDFGPCLVHQRGMQPQEVKLRLRNNDKAELNFSIE